MLQNQQDLSPTADYVWCGQSRVNVPALAGNDCGSLELHAVVFQAGICKLSDYSVVWTYPQLGNLTGSLACPAVTFRVNDANL